MVNKKYDDSTITLIQNKIKNELSVEVENKGEKREDFIKRLINERVEFLRKYLEKANAKGYVLGLSGGIDSFVASMLAKETGYPLVSISIPCGSQTDIEDVIKCKEVIKPDEFISHNIISAVDSHVFQMNMLEKHENRVPQIVIANIMARERMVVQYAYAQLKNCLVIGTDHATESVVGFYTKFGDGAADIMPLSGLTKDIIYDMARHFNAPDEIIDKKPAAGLGLSDNDEDELGISYSDITRFLRFEGVNSEVANKIITKYKATSHKRHLPVTIKDSWWKK